VKLLNLNQLLNISKIKLTSVNLDTNILAYTNIECG
jgi:hypothetical protein